MANLFWVWRPSWSRLVNWTGQEVTRGGRVPIRPFIWWPFKEELNCSCFLIVIFFPLLVFLHSQVRMPGLCLFFYLLRSTKGDRNPNLQVAITHAQQICSLVLPLAHDVIWSPAFRNSSTHNLITRGYWTSITCTKFTQNTLLVSKSVWTFECYRPRSATFD